MLSFKHDHYVPILKSKPGEAWALAKMSSQCSERVSPLIEVIPHKEKGTTDTYLKSVCETFHRALVTRTCFLDAQYLYQNKKDPAKAVRRLFDIAKHRGMRVIPVTGLGREPAFQDALSAAVAAAEGAVLLRLHSDEFRDGDELRTRPTIS